MINAASAAGRALAARRRLADYVCLECGQPFRSTVHREGSTKAPRYCSPRCGVRAWRARRKAAQHG